MKLSEKNIQENSEVFQFSWNESYLDRFIERGYAAIPNFISEEGIRQLLEEIEHLAKIHTPESPFMLARNKYGDILVMNRLDKMSDYLFDLARSEKLIDLSTRMIGKAVIPLHVEYFSKPASNSTATPPHQDQIFYNSHFDDELAISFWIALDDVEHDSGALEYATNLPNTVHPHVKSPSIDFDYELADADTYEFTRVPIRRGDCIAHSSYAIHKTQVNTSGKIRRAIAFNYRGSSYRQWLRDSDKDIK